MAAHRKPAELKRQQGTWRADRNPENEPELPVVSEIPKAPSHLNRWAKAHWKALAKPLWEKKLLTTVDLYALEVCCELYGQYQEAKHAVYNVIDLDTGKVVRKRTLAEYMFGKNSQTMPEYAAMKSAFSQYRLYLGEFGLTPASRNRIDAPKVPDPTGDAMDNLLND